MKNSISIILFSFLIINPVFFGLLNLNSISLMAQDNTDTTTQIAIDSLNTEAVKEDIEVVEMAGIMRSNGKIYVVVAVIAIIFVGLMVYLCSIDQRVKKLEK